ncbi:MAG: hypothetical protein J1F06_01315 [Prevotellaceae bacterium]|nr:hypothetical protein [Prevotellaceae bacterium]
MLETLVISLAIIFLSLLLLSVRLFFGRGFVDTHVGNNLHMRRRGIGCVESMDAGLRNRQNKGIREKSERKTNK